MDVGGGVTGFETTPNLTEEERRLRLANEAKEAKDTGQSTNQSDQIKNNQTNSSAENAGINRSRSDTAAARQLPGIQQAQAGTGNSAKKKEPEKQVDSKREPSLQLFNQISDSQPLTIRIGSIGSRLGTPSQSPDQKAFVYDVVEPNQTQATRYSQMSRERQKEHTVELALRLQQDIDSSAKSFIENEDTLRSLKAPLSPNASPAQRLKHGLDEVKTRLAIEQREHYRTNLILEREQLLKSQGNLLKLVKAGKSDQIHLLFDNEGRALPEDEIYRRANALGNLPDEQKKQYKELTDFLKKDEYLEANFSNIAGTQGLNDQEKVIKAREIIGEELRNSKAQLGLLSQQDSVLNSLIHSSKNIDSSSRLASLDQTILDGIASEAIARRADLFYRIHDSLTAAVQSTDHRGGVNSLLAEQKKIQDGSYTNEEQVLNRYQAKDRDLARTQKEDEKLKESIRGLEAEFQELRDNGQIRITGAETNIASDTKDRDNTGLIGKAMGNDTLAQMSINTLQRYADRLKKMISNGDGDLAKARRQFAQVSQLENYHQALQEVINESKGTREEASLRAQKDFESTRRYFQEVDNAYGNTEAGLKFIRNTAVIAAATIATGGTASLMMGSYGMGALAAGGIGFGAGTAAGTGLGLATNVAEGASRHANGFANPYAEIGSKTYQDFKTSVTTAGATATGMGLTKHLGQVYKWSRMGSSLSGAAGSGLVSTNLNYGFNAGEQLATTGEVDINGKQYLHDLLWNTGSSMAGGAIGSKFGQWQEAASKNAFKQVLLQGGEEATSVGADLTVTYWRDGEITREGLEESFQSVLIGRVQAHSGNSAETNSNTRDVSTQTKVIVKSRVGEVEVSKSGTLDQKHIDQLKEESGINQETLEKAGIETVDFGNYGQALSIPYRNLEGEIIGYQLRLDKDTETTLNSLPKEQLPEGLRMAGDLVSKYQEIGKIKQEPYYSEGFDIKSTNPIIVTEGAKKALKLSESLGEGSQVVGLNGTGNLSSFLNNTRTDLKGKKIFLAFDGDTATNPKVKAAQIDTINQLTKAGADVRIIDIPLNPKDPKQSGIDEFLVRLENDNGISPKEAIDKLLEIADEEGSIDNLEEQLRKVELWQREKLNSEIEFDRTVVPTVQRKNFSENLENILDPKLNPDEVISEFNNHAAKLGNNFQESVKSDLDAIVSLANNIRQDALNPVNFDPASNQRSIDDLRQKLQTVQTKFDQEFTRKINEALDESSRTILALNKTRGYQTIKEASLEAAKDVAKFKSNSDEKQKAVEKLKLLRGKLANIEAAATKPIDDLLQKIGAEIRPNNINLVSRDSTASDVESLLNKITILENSGNKETQATLKILKTELETVLNYKKRQENRDQNTDLENKILDITKDYETGGSVTELDRARTYGQLMKLLDDNNALIQFLKTKSKSTEYNYETEVKNFIDNLHAIREVPGISKLVDSIEKQLASQKGRSLEEVNPKALFGLLREAEYSKKILGNGFEIKEISAGNALNNAVAVLNYRGENVFKDIDYSSRETMIQSLIDNRLADHNVDRNSRFIPLDLRKAGSNGKERFLAMDSFTGEIVSLDNLKPLNNILFETRENTQHYNPVEIDSLIRGQMVENSNGDSNIVEYKLDLAAFVSKNLIRSSMSWDSTTPDLHDEPFVSGELLQIEKHILMAKHFGSNVVIAMDLSKIQSPDGQIIQSGALYDDTRRIFNYLKSKYGLGLGDRISIYDQHGIDKTAYFR